MRECTLISYETEHNIYKGESYMRAFLKFKVVLFGLFSYNKIIFYDVKMFENYREFIEYWDNLIKERSVVPFSIIKHRAIFD